jgi:hypothetical protein
VGGGLTRIREMGWLAKRYGYFGEIPTIRLRERSQLPPLANCAKDRAPLCIGHAGKIKSQAVRLKDIVGAIGMLRSAQHDKRPAGRLLPGTLCC